MPTTRPKAKEIVITAQDFPHRPKNSFWFAGVVILALAGGSVAWYYRDYLSLAVVVAISIALIRVAGLQPDHRTVRLNDTGLTWGNQFFGYHQLKAFWVSVRAGTVMVHFERPNAGWPFSFLIGLDQAEAVVALLERHLPHHSHRGEPVGERFARLIHF